MGSRDPYLSNACTNSHIVPLYGSVKTMDSRNINSEKNQTV